MSETILHQFHPVVRTWFTESFQTPSPPQLLGWPSIADGNHTLIVAPTGSGKTLAAFLWCINHLVEENIAAGRSTDEPIFKEKQRKKGKKEQHRTGIGVRVLYISPLKALGNDIHRNLEIPLNGILQEAEKQGVAMDEIRSAVRTGDTTQTERARMVKYPPDILITTPESFFIMLSSEKNRTMFRSVRYVIVDEIHSISNTKRGVHLSLTLERLEHLQRQSEKNDGAKSFVRIGLSATQKPLETVANFLGGMEWIDGTLAPRHVAIIDAGYKKNTDLKVICAVRDFSDMPIDSIWSLIFPQLLQLIHEHRTTLIFVNNRRLAERVAARLNELMEGTEDTTNNYAVPFSPKSREHEYHPAGDGSFKVFAYHGSMSRIVREQLESDLKLGRLRALITTSALELGIDIGTVDLVVQIQSPKGIARGLQRIGRSGHLVHAESKGRIFITHREDLIEAAVVAQGMLEHSIERTSIPRNCLDVLAQHIVAMVGLETWNIEELYDLIRQSYSYGTLKENIFRSVLEMLSGRYSSESFRELRARVVWNKLHNELSPLPGSTLLAISNAGTIPDRGYFGVYLEDQKTKVGEVDEEFIYESRTGDTFILGSNVWRMTEIDANKVIVSPAPGQPARMPFWRGEGIGRTYELGHRIGEFLQSVSEGRSILDVMPVDANASRNITDYILEQQTSTRIVPSNTTIVVEGFRDEVGDPRIVVHSCFGKGINGLLGIVLMNVLQRRLNAEVQMLYNDDGILFRCSDVERLPLDLFQDLTLSAAQQIVLDEIPSSPLFGALFRQNAERALLLLKGTPGKRRPFFLQRLKSADLLQIVRQYSDFPIVIETIRECLNDVLDFEHFKEIIAKIESGEMAVHTLFHETPSPFATTLLFDFAAVYMYEWDDPKEANKERRTQLNRELLAEVVNLEAIQRVVRRDAVALVEEQLQHTAVTRKARSPEELMEIFLKLGELTEQELRERCEDPGFAEQLQKRGIIIPVSIAGSTLFISAEEIPLYRPICSISHETLSSLPENFREVQFGRDEALRYIVQRMIRSHGALTSEKIARRYGISTEECENILHSCSSTENIVHGILTNDSTTEQWSYLPNLERIHRASISLLRKEIKPASLADFTQLMLRWQQRVPHGWDTDDDDFHTILNKFLGFPLPPELWEPEIFRNRFTRYNAALLRQATQSGEYFCVGTDSGKSQWIARGEGNLFLDPSDNKMEGLTKHAREIYDLLLNNGALLLSDLRDQTSFSLTAINRALSELFWQGLITNDIIDEVFNIKRYRSDELSLPAERIEIVNPRRNPLKAVAMRSARQAFKDAPGWNGRWSIVHSKSILGNPVTDEEKIIRQSQQLLLRYGIVAREIAKREENLVPWPLLALEFQRMEMRGEIRRGYFVEGLSGMQFALPDAVRMLEEIKSSKEVEELPIVVNACDPSNPYGTGIDTESTFGPTVRISRMSGNYCIFHRGNLIMWIENFGMRIYSVSGITNAGQALQQFVHHLRSVYPERNEIIIEYYNTIRPSESPMEPLLRSLGFYRDRMQTMRLDLR